MPTTTTSKLKAICRTHDISGYSGKRKSELTKMVNEHYHQTVDAGLAELTKLAAKQS